MSPEAETPPTANRGTDIISLFARHVTAANLLMATMILTGLVSVVVINKQFFPEFGIDVVQITVEWPGATAEDVDTNIVAAIEPEVRFLDGVKKVRSNSYDGLASVSIEFYPGHPMDSALSDVEQAVTQVTTLPEDTERPKIRRLVRYDTIMRLVLSGPFPEASLKQIAKRIRDDLLTRGIDKVEIFGSRDEEIWVEVDREALRRLDLTLNDVAARIRETSQDLPSGELAGGERQIRSLGLLRDARGVAGIEIKALEDGRKIQLRDIANVTEAFEQRGKLGRRGGQLAFEIHPRRGVDGDSLELAEIVNAYVAEIEPSLPEALTLERYDVEAGYIRDRIRLLVKNGATGLLLVLAILFIFLNGRVAFWVAMGIPTALLATVTIMLFTGQTINMMSLFGLIMALGIVVDDAIVVGEHVASEHARGGRAPLDAAIAGAQRMSAPVVSSTLTTIAAFLPLLLIGGIIGQILTALPLVVIAVLLASLVECFLVLPGHLRGALGEHKPGLLRSYAPRLCEQTDRPMQAFGRFRVRFDAAFSRFREGPFRRLVSLCVEWRYTTIALAVGAFLIACGIIASGRVLFIFFPPSEADRVYANVELAAGSPRSQTMLMVDLVEQAAHRAATRLAGEDNAMIVMSLGKLGTPVGGGHRTSQATTDTIGGVVVELISSDRRDIRTRDFIKAWRDEVPAVAGLSSLTIRGSRAGPPGNDIDVRLNGPDVDTLKKAAVELGALLHRYPDLGDIEDDLPYGRPETVIEVTPRGRALGFNTQNVGRQVRNAVEGAVAKRFPRGDEEVWIRVQFPRADVDSALLESLYLRAPSGAEVALEEAATMRESHGFARIRRENGKRQVSITADIDGTSVNTDQIIEALQRDGLQQIADDYGAQYSFGGRAEEQNDTFADMRVGALLGIIMIYIILAWVFSSYLRPLVVISIIPFGLVGAVLGHLVMGMDLTILSLFGLLGLSGIVINDSIILVTTIDRRAAVQDLNEAIIDGSCDRLRAVLLTSATTIGGLTPLLMERSLQAQFLIPMAVTIVFGLALATLLVLLVIPSLVAIQGDIMTLVNRRTLASPQENA